MTAVTERWLTVVEFCTMYGVSYSTLKLYIKKGIVETQVFALADSTKKHRRIKDPHWTVAGDLETITGSRSIDEVFLLRPCEVAEILGVSVTRVRYLAAAGKLKYYQLHARHRRYTLGAVRQMLAIKETGARKPKRSAVRKAVVAYARTRLMENPLKALD